jgi:predicted DCC family thiol-disulfide oxidoreductase YuxK
MKQNKPNIPLFPIRVFFDGSCSVCTSEIGYYLHQDHGGKLLAVDITAPDFDPKPYRITRDEFMRELHVIDQGGNVYLGTEAFQAIWMAFQPLTMYRLMGGIIGLPLVSPVAKLLYKAFAAVRPYLPKRDSSCSDGICRFDRH